SRPAAGSRLRLRCDGAALRARRRVARGKAGDRGRPLGAARPRPRLGRRPERGRCSRGWGPLHYVCHSCFASVELARELLRRGADANAFYANEHGPMSTLYGAAGVRHDPELTRALLEAGADPNAEPWFGDALYHSVEAESPECLRLLLEHGAEPR